MTTGTTARLREYCQKNGIGEIGMSHKVIRGIEIGNRYFGDPLCWYIPNRNDGQYLLKLVYSRFQYLHHRA